MRIIRLQAEGFKRLVAVDITPEGDLIEIRGNNGEGKSSVLDSIWEAIGGADAAKADGTVKPVRTGADYAIIRLALGEKGGDPALLVTKFFDADGTTKLKVENADGAVYSQGQTMLDALVGAIAFDPLAFKEMKPADQAAEIRRLVKLDVDLDKLAAADKADYDARRDVNRDAAALKARIEAIVVPADLPETGPDKDAIADELSSAAEKNSAIERDRIARENEADYIRGREGAAATDRAEAEELRKRADELDARAAETDKEVARRREVLDGMDPLPTPVDVTEVRARLAEAERLAELIRRRDERAGLAADFRALKERSEGLTAAMTERAAAREKALASAEMPIPGLGFATIDDQLLVTFNGEPFSQASSAEQLRASTAIAIAANPKLRVIRIKDGSLLDKNGLKLLAEIAAEHDCQIWGEFVGDDGPGIIMEAGVVRGAPEPERVEPPKRRKKKEEEEAGPAHKFAAEAVAATGGGVDRRERPEQITETAKPARKRPAAFDEISTPPADRLL